MLLNIPSVATTLKLRMVSLSYLHRHAISQVAAIDLHLSKLYATNTEASSTSTVVEERIRPLKSGLSVELVHHIPISSYPLSIFQHVLLFIFVDGNSHCWSDSHALGVERARMGRL